MTGSTIVIVVLSVLTFLGVIITIVWGSGLWRNREKTRLKFNQVSYSIRAYKGQLGLWPYMEFWRVGGRDLRYINKVILRPQRDIYEQLRKYFDLPKDEITLKTRIELPRDAVVSSDSRLPQYSYTALESFNDTQEQQKAGEIAQRLNGAAHTVGLVWEDNNKTIWKTVTPANFEKWL